MPRWQRVYLAVCAGIVGYTLGYVAVDYARLPRLVYFQHERTFRWRVGVVDPVPSGYVGLWLWALLFGVVAAAAGYLVARLVKKPLSERMLGLIMAWAATAFVIAIGYYTWNNWP